MRTRHRRRVAEDRDERREVGVVAHEHRSLRVAQVDEQALDLGQAERLGQALVDAHLQAQRVGDRLGGLDGARAWGWRR